MQIRPYVDWLNDNGYLRPSDGIQRVVQGVQGFSQPWLMATIAEAVKLMGAHEYYLEIGSFLGRTLIGALVDNDHRALSIDNFSEFNDKGENESIFMKNLDKFGVRERVEFFKQDTQKWLGAHEKYHGRVGVYFYDGNHQPDQGLEALEAAIPYFSNDAIILLDDVSGGGVWETQARFFEKYWRMVNPLFYMHTPNFPYGQEHWHNGISVMHWHWHRMV